LKLVFLKSNPFRFKETITNKNGATGRGKQIMHDATGIVDGSSF
jgi:hypothetical protein